jgi:PAS domain S-box-containing protein
MEEEKKNRIFPANPESVLNQLTTGTDELMSALMDNIPAPTLISGEDGTIIYVNPATEKMTGYSGSELIGTKPPFPWWPEELKNRYTSENATISKRAISEQERMGIRKNGEMFWVTINLRHIRDKGKVKLLIANWFDITERKRIEEELKESEAFKNSLLERAPNPIVVYDASDSVKYVNPAFEKLTGYSSSEAVGLTIPYPWWIEQYASESTSKKIQDIKVPVTVLEKCYHKKNGELFWVSISLGQILEKEKVSLYVSNWVDITERKHMEEALRESEEKHRLLVENSHDIIYTLSADGIFTFVSSAWTMLLGHQTDQVIGRSFQQFVHPEDVPQCKDFLDLAIQTGQRQSGIEYRVQHIDGSWHMHSSSAVVHKDKTGVTFYGIARDVTETKKAEEALKESEAFAATLLDKSPNPILVVNPGTSIRYINPALEKLTGFSKEEILGKTTPYPWWPPDFSEDFKSGKIGAAREVDYEERRFCRKNGTPFWVAISIRHIKENGVTRFILGNWVDITQRKNAEEALKESEAFKAILLDDSPNPIFVYKPDGSIIYANTSLEILTGYKNTELIGQKMPYPWWPADKHQQYINENLSVTRGNIRLFERIYRKKNGEPFWIAVSTRLIKQDGEIKYFIANWVDITQRKKMEDDLRESEAYSVSLLTEAPNPVVVVNPDGTIKYVNPAMERLTGYSSAEVVGISPPHPWWPKGKNQEYSTQISEDKKKSETVTEKYFIKKNGEPFWVSIRIRQIKENNSIKHVLSNWVDITRLKMLEERISDLYTKEKKHREELQEEAQARGLFINVLAHELRAPLTPIMVSTGMLRDLLEPQKKEILSKLVSNIYSSTENLSLRLEELLDLARYDRGTFRLNLQIVSLQEFLHGVIRRFEPAILKRGQQLTTRFDMNLPSWKIDPSRLEQVLINLLSNASKFSGDGTEILLTAGIENNRLLIEVRDQGIGISNENQQRLFRPYHRVEQDRKQFPGLGLGLAVSKQIIEAHGGKIWVKSQPGQGSTFGFDIPLNPTI